MNNVIQYMFRDAGIDQELAAIEAAQERAEKLRAQLLVYLKSGNTRSITHEEILEDYFPMPDIQQSLDWVEEWCSENKVVATPRQGPARIEFRYI